MYSERADTIAAVATPAGRGGVGIIRVSGPAAKTVARQLTGAPPAPRRACFRRFLDADGGVIDEGIALFFSAPASYTGEDVFEIHAHGSPVVLDMLLARVLEIGARPAQPGEFSYRAFVNDKYDLAQLEAVADLIDSAGTQAAKSAQRVLQGEFSRGIHHLSEEIKELRVLIESALDFAEEDVDVVDDHRLKPRLQELAGRLAELERRAVQGARLREGIELVVAGRPNVGKSSLLNRLAEREEAIVSDLPGTTRDVVKSEILLDGIPVHALDTAGLRDPGHPVEAEGIRRAHAAMDAADIVLVLVDASAGIGEHEKNLVESLRGRTAVLVVYNKTDLVNTARPRDADAWISAKTGDGLDGLRTCIKAEIGVADLGEDAIVARRRHLNILAQARTALETAVCHLAPESGAVHLELAAEGLREAQQALAAIVGEYTTEELLGDIFSRFCIGK